MISSIFLSLFFIATVIFIVNSHYRWTYFFAIALFVLLFSSMFAITGQWQRGLNFASVLFVVLMLFHRMKIHYYKQPLLILDFSFYLVTEWIGEPFGREGQEGFWLEQRELDAGQFPPANLKLIQRLVAESVK